jgi:tRNA(fMet)-specific endonuclease VapC
LDFGAHRAESSAQRRQRAQFLADVLAQYPVAPFGLEEARVFAQLSATLTRLGRPIGTEDMIIAATAIAGAHDVMTLNRRHFEGIPGLQLRDLPSL